MVTVKEEMMMFPNLKSLLCLQFLQTQEAEAQGRKKRFAKTNTGQEARARWQKLIVEIKFSLSK